MLQVAGHHNIKRSFIVQDGAKVPVVLKPTVMKEIQFYIDAQDTQLAQWLPKYYGYYAMQNILYLAIEDLSENATGVLDLKIGKRHYDDDASEQKREQMIRKVNETTSKVCGLRICGMSGTALSMDKNQGRSLNHDQLKEALQKFFGTHAQLVKTQARLIVSVLPKHVELYSASLFVVTREDSAVVRLIDFAHSKYQADYGNKEDITNALYEV